MRSCPSPLNAMLVPMHGSVIVRNIVLRIKAKQQNHSTTSWRKSSKNQGEESVIFLWMSILKDDVVGFTGMGGLIAASFALNVNMAV